MEKRRGGHCSHGLLGIFCIVNTLAAAVSANTDTLQQSPENLLDTDDGFPDSSYLRQFQMSSGEKFGSRSMSKRLSATSFSLARGKKETIFGQGVLEGPPQRRISPSQFMGMRGKRASPPDGFLGLRGKRFEQLLEDMESDDDRLKRQPPVGYVVVRGKRQPPSGFLGLRGKKDALDFYGMPDKKYTLPFGFQGARGKRPVLLPGKRRLPSGFLGARGKRLLDILHQDPYSGENFLDDKMEGFREQHSNDEMANSLDGGFWKRQLSAGFVPMRG